MTEYEIKESKEWLQDFIRMFDCNFDDSETRIFNKIVTCLEELKQYKEIGTVEELKSMKENGAFTGVELAQLAAMQMRLKEYSAIGTIEEFKALKEKSVAKKPIRNDLCTCPSCGTFSEVIGKRRNTVAFDTVYCWHCGQAIEIKRN